MTGEGCPHGKPYIPILPYRNKALNALSHAGTYSACIGLVALGFVNVFSAALSEDVVRIGACAGLIAFPGGLVCIGVIWIAARIVTRKAK